jgi:transposase
VVAEPVKVRRSTDQEGQKLQRIVRRGSTSTRYRRAMIVLASAGGNRVPVIAQLVQADQDTVRDVIHASNEIGLACLDPQWAGDRPRLLNPDQQAAAGRTIRIGREALRCLLARRAVTFQRTKTWKESTDPEIHIDFGDLLSALIAAPSVAPLQGLDQLASQPEVW